LYNILCSPGSFQPHPLQHHWWWLRSGVLYGDANCWFSHSLQFGQLR